MRKGFVSVLIASLVMATIMPAQKPIDAKTRTVSLSRQKVSLAKGERYTLTIKNASSKAKVTWKISNKEVIKFTSKTKKKVRFIALQDGKATVSAVYQLGRKKKVLKCKISVRKHSFSDERSDNKPEENDTDTNKAENQKACLNVTCASIYFIDPYFEEKVTAEEGHNAEFPFKVWNTDKKVKTWEMVGENASKFSITDTGIVSGRFAPAYDISGKLNAYEGTVQATLTDGTKLQAKVLLYDEVVNYLYHYFDTFVANYISEDMTELEKVTAVAKYIGECSDYDPTMHGWKDLFIFGKGDCQASRYAVQYLCQYMGIKAGACRSVDYHGETLVLADGSYYIITTGFDMPRPREYMISRVPDEQVEEIMEEREVIKSYFR